MAPPRSRFSLAHVASMAALRHAARRAAASLAADAQPSGAVELLPTACRGTGASPER